MRRIALTVSVTKNQLVKQIQVLVIDLVSIIRLPLAPDYFNHTDLCSLSDHV